MMEQLGSVVGLAREPAAVEQGDRHATASPEPQGLATGISDILRPGLAVLAWMRLSFGRPSLRAVSGLRSFCALDLCRSERLTVETRAGALCSASRWMPGQRTSTRVSSSCRCRNGSPILATCKALSSFGRKKRQFAGTGAVHGASIPCGCMEQGGSACAPRELRDGGGGNG